MSNPVVVSFYTEEYTDLAERMQKSVQRFGIPSFIDKIEKVNGSWLDTIYTRAEFILNWLNLRFTDVIWLDSDAVMNQRPDLFFDFEGDFGIHIHDFEYRKNEYLGGTMYFANNERTKQFLRNWIRINQTTPKRTLSQWVIPEAIAQTPELKVVPLPATYCQIFDTMVHCGDPVISHYQASRKFRK